MHQHAGDRDPDDAGARSSRSSRTSWRDFFVLVVGAVLLAVVVKTFVLQVFYVPTGSMRSTLQVDDRIVVEKWSYWSGGPERGDVVVFSDPGGWLPPSATDHGPVTEALSAVGLYPAGGHLVKRVVGVGGDTVTCRRGVLRVNGDPVDEDAYVTLGPSCRSPFAVQVPADSLWVLGDNRDASADSRFHTGEPGGGFVPEDRVVGKVVAVAWPLSRLGLVGSADSLGSAAPYAPHVDSAGQTFAVASLLLVSPRFGRRWRREGRGRTR